MSLSRSELRTWHQLITGIRALMTALDRRLRDEAGISHDDYMVLARLYRAPDRTMTMSDLAHDVSFSQSRLSNTVGRYETKAWVSRKTGRTDKRSVEVTLTELGVTRTREITSKHLDHVRALVLDALGPTTARQTAQAFDQIRKGVDEST